MQSKQNTLPEHRKSDRCAKLNSLGVEVNRLFHCGMFFNAISNGIALIILGALKFRKTLNPLREAS